MQLPILSYGHALLQQQTEEISPVYPELGSIIENMWETLYKAEGCGLAAPQVGYPLRLFLVDSRYAYQQMHPESRLVYFDDNTGIREVFINAHITSQSERTWKKEEACLSLPGMQAEIDRPWTITIEYFDQYFHPRTKIISGISARMIQHEYDHILGILYIDHLNPFKRKRWASGLKKIAKGLVKTRYPMRFSD